MTTIAEWRKWNALRTKPITNYDRIISKSPEEMAEFMAKTHCVHKAPHCRESDCTQCWLDWLQKEVSD